jgi:short-subunit dehydrogenase
MYTPQKSPYKKGKVIRKRYSAVVTGGSSGIGAETVRLLCKMGYSVTAVGRDEAKLRKFAVETGCSAVVCDLSNEKSVSNLLKLRPTADILINCAGYGIYGDFVSRAEKDGGRAGLSLIDVNVRAAQQLMAGYLPQMVKRGGGYVLNYSSIAAFMPGVHMSEYFASKAYILSLSLAVNEELKKSGSPVYVGAVCPGPTNGSKFFERAGTAFRLPEQTARHVAVAALNGMFREEPIIFTSPINEILSRGAAFIPEKLLVKIIGDFYTE